MAQSVSLHEAESVALRYANQYSREANKSISKGEVISLYGRAPLYLISLNDGWVLVSSERAATPILSSSPTGIFPVDGEMPDGMRWLLSYYEAAMQYAQDSITEKKEDAEWEFWLNDESNLLSPYTRNEHTIERMAEVKWNQSSNNGHYNNCIKPYNYYCPSWVQPSCDHAYVGCTAVAIGQVMWYYQWPHSAIVPACMNDSNGNVCNSVRLVEYNWDLMPAAIYATTPWDKVYEIAGFLRDCGYSCNMAYKYDGSYASILDAQNALTQNFHYKSTNLCRKDDFPIGWIELLKNTLNSDQPIIYSGYNSSETDGHTFVIFGYENNLFRINWGWGGQDINTLYSLSPLKESGHDYSYSQYALLGIRPDYPECGSQTLSFADISQSPFEVYGKESVVGMNKTISSPKTGVIYAGQMIQLLPPFTIQNGANIHLAIKEMHCDLSDLDIQSGLLIDENDTIAGDVPERYNLPAYIELQQTEEEPLSETEDSTPYNLLGQPVDESYHGIVIKNGQKVLQ